MRKLLFLIPLLIVLATCHEEEKVEEPTLNAEELLTSVFELFGYKRNHTRPHIIPPFHQERMTPTEPTHGNPDPLDPTHGDLTKLTQYSLPSIQETKLMEPMLP